MVKRRGCKSAVPARQRREARTSREKNEHYKRKINIKFSRPNRERWLILCADGAPPHLFRHDVARLLNNIIVLGRTACDGVRQICAKGCDIVRNQLCDCLFSGPAPWRRRCADMAYFSKRSYCSVIAHAAEQESECAVDKHKNRHYVECRKIQGPDCDAAFAIAISLTPAIMPPVPAAGEAAVDALGAGAPLGGAGGGGLLGGPSMLIFSWSRFVLLQVVREVLCLQRARTAAIKKSIACRPAGQTCFF